MKVTTCNIHYVAALIWVPTQRVGDAYLSAKLSQIMPSEFINIFYVAFRSDLICDPWKWQFKSHDTILLR